MGCAWVCLPFLWFRITRDGDASACPSEQDFGFLAIVESFDVDAVFFFGELFEEGGGCASAERAKFRIAGGRGRLRRWGGFACDRFFADFCCGLGRRLCGRGFGTGLILLGLLRGGEVAGGDLEGVEDEAGAAGVDAVVGEAVEDLAKRGLDVGPAGGWGEQEDVAAGLALAWIGDGFAGVVVVVAEVHFAQAGAAAAQAVGKDVAALAAFGFLVVGAGDGV